MRQGGEPVLESVSPDTDDDVSEADVDLPVPRDGKFALKFIEPKKFSGPDGTYQPPMPYELEEDLV